MLDTGLKTQLSTYLEKITGALTLEVAVDASEQSTKLLVLANEIAELSTLITVKEVTSGHERTPSLSVIGEKNQSQITFAGLPMGHEFTSLVLALLHAGEHPVKLPEDDINAIKSLQGELKFHTYVSLSCQSCPVVVQALNMMAALNPNISHTMIDGAVFQDEVKQNNILSVPAVYLNNEPFAQGRVTLSDVLAKLDTTSSEDKIEQLNSKPTFDVLVIGGGPAGASAAIYAARKGLVTGVVADRFGGQVADTLGIENFISVKATQGPQLIAQLEEHVKDYDVDIMQGLKASKIERNELVEITLNNGAVLTSKSVILATGARWREMNVPGEQEYRGAGVAYCPHCDGPLFKGKDVAVIGGGNSGIEAAIDLANIVKNVTVLEFDSVLRADEVLVKKANSMGNINIIKQAQTTEVRGDNGKVVGLTYLDRASQTEQQIDLAGIFVQIGLVPNSEWLKESLDLTERGEIIIGNQGQTSMPGVYAAGDVTDTVYKQIIIAMGSGATAALGAFDYLMRLPVNNENSAAA